ncbi:uncharacterized protein pear1 [Aplochiton taeniatus]
MQFLQRCLLGLNCLIGLSWALNPRDPNVCSVWESFTAPVKESYSHPYDQLIEEPCSDSKAFYRCSSHRIIYKTAYRQAVKMDYRQRYQCCPGYYESRDKCVPRCTKECVHGRCVAPDRCQCEGGWRGEDCSSACDDKHWGPGCVQKCKCENGALCNPVSGSCQCPPGYIGRLCEDPCPAGTFGKGCLQMCRCGTGGSCDKLTGECHCREGFTGTFCEESCIKKRCRPRCSCQNGGICQGKGFCACPPGWTGTVCTERCPARRFGPNCAEECVCHNKGHCDPETGQCQCAEGFTGPRCNEECSVGSYGQDCGRVCDCANGARCYNIDGGCLCEPGFRGPQCRERMCPHGAYGLHCECTCLCQDKHTLSCHPMKGECTCKPGWAGLYCNETCAHGYYGQACLEPCLCVNGGVCDSETGRCQCVPGYTGDHCETPCKSGTYGKNCSQICPCTNAFDCSPYDGTCLCKEGWRGLDCSLPCLEGTWGSGCNTSCQCANMAECNPADGSCTCTAGWQGVLCDQQCAMGAFGPGCLESCDCVHADGCQGFNGQCHCLPGWWGAHCSDLCPEGLWGRQCSQTCSCQNSATCRPDSGTCLCSPGYWGPSCQYICPTGFYGNHCSEVCKLCANNSTCHHEDGHCECLPGWTSTDCSQLCAPGQFGPYCSQSCWCPPSYHCDPHTGDCICKPGLESDCKQESRERSGSVMVLLPPSEGDSWAAIGGIVGLVIVVVLLLALLLLYRRRQQHKQANTPTVSFSSPHTVNSEYALPDVPPSYHHYYSNPSYHTLSQNRLPLPHLPNNHERLIKNTNKQLFCSMKNPEREQRGLFGVESNTTLPADWKHHKAHKDHGAYGIDRSYSFSASLGKYYNKDMKGVLAVSSSSLNSENPYATIKDLPSLPLSPSECSYVEMKSTLLRERTYTEINPVTLNTNHPHTRECVSPCHVPEEENQSHYDLPVNSHILGHYDLPPVRRTLSP